MQDDTTHALSSPTRRRIINASVMALCLPACKPGPQKFSVDVVFSSYLSRVISDVMVGTAVLGVSGVYPNIGGSLIVGANFIEGPQSVTWTLGGPEGTPRNGEVIVARNRPDLRRPREHEAFLSLHIYPDDTVELLYSRNFPRPSARGAKYIEAFERDAPSN